MGNIEYLLNEGQYKQCLKVLSKVSDLSPRDKIFKARALEMACDESIFEAEIIINDVLDNTLNDIFLEIEARSAKLMILLKLTNFPNILDENQIFEKTWNKLDEEAKNNLQVSYAQYLLVSYYVKAYTSVDIDDFITGSRKILEAVNIFIQNNNIYYALYALYFKTFLDTVNLNIKEINNNIDIIKHINLDDIIFEKLIYYWIMSYKEICTGNIIKATKLLEETLDRSSTLPWIHITVAYSLSTFQIMAGKYDEAIPLLENAIEMADKLQVSHNIAWGKRGLANIYYSMGEIDKARILVENALQINKDIHDQSCLTHSLSLASKIYYQLGNDEKAIKLSSEAYTIIEPKKISIIDIFILIDGYYYKLILLLESGEMRQATEFYRSLQQRYTPGQYNEMDYYMELFEALLLKYEKRITKKVKAQSILEKLVTEEISAAFIIKELKIYAIFHYLELLLHEFNEFEESDVLDEIHSLLSTVISFSEKHKLNSFKLRFMIIEAQLFIIQGNFIEADNLLSKLKTSLELQQNIYLKKRVEDQIVKLNKTIKKFKASTVGAFTLNERIKSIEIMDYVKKVIELKEVE